MRDTEELPGDAVHRIQCKGKETQKGKRDLALSSYLLKAVPLKLLFQCSFWCAI